MDKPNNQQGTTTNGDTAQPAPILDDNRLLRRTQSAYVKQIAKPAVWDSPRSNEQESRPLKRTYSEQSGLDGRTQSSKESSCGRTIKRTASYAYIKGKGSMKHCAQKRYNNVLFHLGTYKTEEEAQEVHDRFAIEITWDPKLGAKSKLKFKYTDIQIATIIAEAKLIKERIAKFNDFGRVTMGYFAEFFALVKHEVTCIRFFNALYSLVNGGAQINLVMFFACAIYIDSQPPNNQNRMCKKNALSSHAKQRLMDYFRCNIPDVVFTNKPQLNFLTESYAKGFHVSPQFLLDYMLGDLKEYYTWRIKIDDLENPKSSSSTVTLNLGRRFKERTQHKLPRSSYSVERTDAGSFSDDSNNCDGDEEVHQVLTVPDVVYHTNGNKQVPRPFQNAASPPKPATFKQQQQQPGSSLHRRFAERLHVYIPNQQVVSPRARSPRESAVFDFRKASPWHLGFRQAPAGERGLHFLSPRNDVSTAEEFLVLESIFQMDALSPDGV